MSGAYRDFCNSLATGSFAGWTVTDFKDFLISTLSNDRDSSAAELQFFLYAVTEKGWMEIRQSVVEWKSANKNRHVMAYVGTDHAITDPEGLEAMQKDCVAVRLMQNYQGIFHPKVVWLKRDSQSVLLAGSNNITRDGLLNNIEFALGIRFNDTEDKLVKWAEEVHSASAELTKDTLESYRKQRKQFESKRMKSRATTFTWRGKENTIIEDKFSQQAGNLVIEVMPRETGQDGKQIQLPQLAARDFFKCKDSKQINLTEVGQPGSMRTLTMTKFSNNTVRLVINELKYRDRPCVIVFHKDSSSDFSFKIVSEYINPKLYRTLIKNQCTNQTRTDSRRWGIIQG